VSDPFPPSDLAFPWINEPHPGIWFGVIAFCAAYVFGLMSTSDENQKRQRDTMHAVVSILAIYAVLQAWNAWCLYNAFARLRERLGG